MSHQNGEAVFASLAEILPVGIFHADPLGNCLYVNERWCQISGLKFEESRGMGWLNGIYPSDRELVEAEWNESVQEKRHFSLEYRFLNQYFGHFKKLVQKSYSSDKVQVLNESTK
jgi:PAS domain S-box-containing protein